MYIFLPITLCYLCVSLVLFPLSATFQLIQHVHKQELNYSVRLGRTCSKYGGGETLAGYKILACGTRKDKTTCCMQAEVGE